MNRIAFVDTEIDPRSQKILDIGSVKESGSSFHSNSIKTFCDFIKGVSFICGHNIFNHDLKYIRHALNEVGIDQLHVIDTLFLSPLLFPSRPYHALLKDDKLQTEELNNPLNDAVKAKDLFYDELSSFKLLDDDMKDIYFLLLHDKKEFFAFFDFVSYKSNHTGVEKLICRRFDNEICKESDLENIILHHPVELAYCLALISSRNRYSITPPWVLNNFPQVESIMFLLRSKPLFERLRLLQ